MQPRTGNTRNGVTWIRDCLLHDPALSQAIARLEGNCRSGIRHFSAIRVAVALEQARSMESDLLRLEDEPDVFDSRR